MSIETPSWNTGAVHASVRRRAIVLRIEVIGDDLDLARRRAADAAAGGAAGAADWGALDVLGDDAAVRPGARQRREVDPRSRAIRRASGDALIRPPPGSGGPAPRRRCRPPTAQAPRPPLGPGGRSGCLGRSGSASPARAPRRRAAVVAAVPITAIVEPTSTSPSATTILSSTPSKSDSTSCVTLSVSSSYSGSRFVTASPSALSQRTIVPDSMPWPSRGSLTSVAITSPRAARAAARGSRATEFMVVIMLTRR